MSLSLRYSMLQHISPPQTRTSFNHEIAKTSLLPSGVMLVRDERPLFGQRMKLGERSCGYLNYLAFHKGQFIINSVPIGNPDRLDKDAKKRLTRLFNLWG